MAKKIRFPLEMADGVHVRTLAELKEHFDAERVVGYYLDGKLKTWLDDRYIEKEAAAVDALSRDDEALAQKLCEIFGVEYLGDLDPEEIAYRNERIARLKQLTDDPEIIKQVDIVAFDQDDLFDRYDEGRTKIILAEGEFDIPESKKDIEYVCLGESMMRVENQADEQLSSQDITSSEVEYNVYINNIDSHSSIVYELNCIFDNVWYPRLGSPFSDILLELQSQNLITQSELDLLHMRFNAWLILKWQTCKNENNISPHFKFKTYLNQEEATKAKDIINDKLGEMLCYTEVTTKRQIE